MMKFNNKTLRPILLGLFLMLTPIFTAQATNLSLEEQHQQNVEQAPEHLPAMVYLLAQITEAEAKGEPYIGKVAVAEVVLNRVKSPDFPNNVSDVVFQENQFEPVRNGTIANTPSEESFRAAYEALNGSNYAQGALFFWNESIAKNRWQETLTTVTVIGNHTFNNP